MKTKIYSKLILNSALNKNTINLQQILRKCYTIFNKLVAVQQNRVMNAEGTRMLKV